MVSSSLMLMAAGLPNEPEEIIGMKEALRIVTFVFQPHNVRAQASQSDPFKRVSRLRCAHPTSGRLGEACVRVTEGFKDSRGHEET